MSSEKIYGNDFVHTNTMNTLQAALGNNERYTKATLLRLCMANGVDHHNGGMTVNGFMLMYRKLGSVATAKDLAKLKMFLKNLINKLMTIEY